jgi:hypothetical protein
LERARAVLQQPEFRRALERLYAGEPDPVTVGLLA